MNKRSIQIEPCKLYIKITTLNHMESVLKETSNAKVTYVGNFILNSHCLFFGG